MERLLLSAVQMEKIIFGSKQFYLGTIRLTRRWLTPFGLTPARFNMLCAITTSGFRGLAQHDLLGLLGVTSATISRMLRSLEELGLIVRKPHPRNPQRRWVTITWAGAHRLRAAIDEVVDSGELAWAVAEILNPHPGRRATAEAAIKEMDILLTRGRVSLSDIATLTFPYDRDEAPGSPPDRDRDRPRAA
jgi:DNA-binding MarR family transcriptional regulator